MFPLVSLASMSKSPFSMTDCKTQGIIATFASLSWATMFNHPSQWRTAQQRTFSISFLANNVQQRFSVTDCNVQGKFIMFPLVSLATMFNGPCQLWIAKFTAMSSSVSHFLRQLSPITLLSDRLQWSWHFHHVGLTHLGYYIQLPISLFDRYVQGIFIMFALLSWATMFNHPSQWWNAMFKAIS